MLWREVFLVQDDADNGGVLTMALLRPLEWLSQHDVAEGAWEPIDLPEMGVQGEALVTAVQPCPEIEEGEGRLVTGTFRRSQALVMELKVAGESDVLGVTGNHLVWSEDRQDWVAVKDLRIGERMRAWDGGTPEVESLTACSEPEPVHNLEVEGDHCYRVGEQGLLVHNASQGNPAPQPPPCPDLAELFKDVNPAECSGIVLTGKTAKQIVQEYLPTFEAGLTHNNP